MAGLSYPFDAGPGSTITEDQWSYLVKDSLGNGVHEDANAPYSGELETFTIAEPGIVRLRAGRATINGFHYQQGGEEVVVVTANANVTMDRIDALVLRLDLATDAISPVVKLGVAATTPAPPAIDVNELPLATFTVPKNSSTVLDVVDMRVFVGRRMLIDKGDPNVGARGDLIYSYFSDRWSGMREDGFADQLAFKSEIDDHIAAVDPHPQYLTLAEGSEQVITSPFSNDPLFSTHGEYHRAIKLPGGRYINHFYYYGTFNGATNEGDYVIGTITDPLLRPTFAFLIPGHQWRFANAMGAYPLIVSIGNTGTVRTTSTWLEGGAHILVSATYFSGPGV